MENREIAVAVSGVKKNYRLGQIGGGTLQKDLQSWWARVRKKEDPNQKLGSKRIVGETLKALDGIDLKIYEGERLGIIGRNGAGKSTLLKLLAEVTSPTEGDIDIYGRITSMLEVGTGFHSEMTGRENIYMNGAILGMFQLIAGPCAIESEELTLEIASHMKKVCSHLEIPYTFKASFDKANRTSIDSFRGPGIDEGLRILKRVKDELALPVCTDIHEPWQAEKAASAADIIQIPAFLCRQTDLLVAAAKTGRCVNIKKAQFLAPWDMKNCVDKVMSSGNQNVMVTERGTSFGYNNLVADFTSIAELKKLGVPVLFDATHSAQKPGGNGTSTGGRREYVPLLARAAVAAGADGLYFETHPDPDKAKSDGANMVPLGEMEELLASLRKIYLAL